MLTQTAHKEQLREALLRIMAAAPSVAYPPAELARRVRGSSAVDAPFDERDVSDALALLQGVGLAKPHKRPLSGLQDWRITSDGVQFFEANYA